MRSRAAARRLWCSTIYALVDCVQTDRRGSGYAPSGLAGLAVLVPGRAGLLVPGRSPTRGLPGGPGRWPTRVPAAPTTTPTSCAGSELDAPAPPAKEISELHGHPVPVDRGRPPRTLPAAVSPILIGTGAAYSGRRRGATPSSPSSWPWPSRSASTTPTTTPTGSAAPTGAGRPGPARRPAPRRAPRSRSRRSRLLLRRRWSGSRSWRSAACG